MPLLGTNEPAERTLWLRDLRAKLAAFGNRPLPLGDRYEWNREPNADILIAQGLPCVIVRGPVGALCGYVGVPAGHKLYGIKAGLSLVAEQSDVWTTEYIGVHGGVTFTGWQWFDEAHEYWWVGFDTGHLNDLAPAVSWSEGTYRNLAYVRAECQRLAAQLAGM